MAKAQCWNLIVSEMVLTFSNSNFNNPHLENISWKFCQKQIADSKVIQHLPKWINFYKIKKAHLDNFCCSDLFLTKLSVNVVLVTVVKNPIGRILALKPYGCAIYITILTIMSVCPFGVRCLVSVCHKIFFSLKSPWNHPLTPGVDPQGWPRVAPGHAAPPEELEYARQVGIF